MLQNVNSAMSGETIFSCSSMQFSFTLFGALIPKVIIHNVPDTLKHCIPLFSDFWDQKLQQTHFSRTTVASMLPLVIWRNHTVPSNQHT